MSTARNIVLVGFMGSGKSAVARELARLLGWRAVDTDALVEERAGISVGGIFDAEGEAGFRDQESGALGELASGAERLVVATGGGIVLREENWPLLRSLGPVVALGASVETILGRIGESSTRRPLLEVPEPRTEIERRLKDRAPWYGRADYQVPTDGKSPAQVAKEVLGLLSLEKK